jgi:prepilin-type N-terminal cleavage/methylation domain-containing protein
VSTRDLRSRRLREDGFTLVEVMIALGLTALVMAAALPAFIAMLRSTVSVKLDTQGKNLTQERAEQIRDLRFHIDRQNGPFLDLLDIYYTNALSAGTPTALTVGGTLLTGSYVASGAAAAGEPAAPFYRVTTGTLAGTSGFRQKIDTQFLAPDGSVIPASRFQDVYNSQVAGKDQAPSLMVGVTVITSWKSAGKTKSYRTYTRISDGRSAAPVIQTQGRAVAVDVTSTAADGTTLELQQGVASADGSQSSGSTVAGYATGALASRSGYVPVSGLLTQFNLPTQAVSTTGSSSPQAGSGCHWYGFGRTAVVDGTGSVATGLPKAPSDVDSATPANQLYGSVMDNSGSSCGLLSFDNLEGGGLARPAGDLLGDEMGAAPYVSVPDIAGGSASAISGGAYVSSNALTSVPQKSISGASAFAKRKVVLFPNNPESGGQGLVSVTLGSAQVDCGSGSSSTTGSVVGKYAVTLGWWGQHLVAPLDANPRWHTATWSYDSSAASPMTLASGSDTWDPNSTRLGNGTMLNQLIVSSFGTAPAVVNNGALQSGLRGFTNGILSLTTASTLVNEAGVGYSAIKLQLGQLTCVADDQR